MNMFAVAVFKDEAIIGHVQQKISAVCSMFLCRGSSILCQVAEFKLYSVERRQCGLEILCILVFIGSAKDIARVEKLVTGALGPTASLYFHTLHVSTSF